MSYLFQLNRKSQIKSSSRPERGPPFKMIKYKGVRHWPLRCCFIETVNLLSPSIEYCHWTFVSSRRSVSYCPSQHTSSISHHLHPTSSHTTDCVMYRINAPNQVTPSGMTQQQQPQSQLHPHQQLLQTQQQQQLQQLQQQQQPPMVLNTMDTSGGLQMQMTDQVALLTAVKAEPMQDSTTTTSAAASTSNGGHLVYAVKRQRVEE